MIDSQRFGGRHLAFLEEAVELALQAESEGNLPIGSVIVLEGEIVARGASRLVVPHYHPGRHAEMEALREVPAGLWPRARQMTCYSTLEPCLMCMGSLLLHGVGRVVFGAVDPQGGGGEVLRHHLPTYYSDGAGVPEWIGPLLPGVCDRLYLRVKRRFDALPCGRGGTG